MAALQVDLDDVLNCFKLSIERAINEEEVKVRVSACIEEKILKPLNVDWHGRYEYTLIWGNRVDALYGNVVVEYKAPGKLSSATDVARAKKQIVEYITKLAKSETEWGRYLGVVISDKVAFVKYDKRRSEWILRGPYDITKEVIVKFIEALRGLRRRALEVDALLQDFGPQSELAKKAVKTLHDKLAKSRSERTRTLFEDWRRLFEQATGYGLRKPEGLSALASKCGLSEKVDASALMFSIQTYYAFLMKLLAAEVAYIYGSGKLLKSYVTELEDAYTRGGIDSLKEALKELEGGGVFRQLGYENFLEGDHFSWYLDELDEELAKVLVEIVKELGKYEPATPQLEPEFARDLLKRLYQCLVPREVRHSLGEYYTPDWLADLLLDEVGLSLSNLENAGKEDPRKPLRIRVLDPACGSGTFLVRYIARLREYAEEHYLRDELVDYLLKNVVGFDLNPLAVLAARTNYLLMIADLPKRGKIEIPVYLADSLMIEKRATLAEGVYELKTAAGEFQLPASLVERGAIADVLSEVSEALKNELSAEDFRNRLRHVFKTKGLPGSAASIVVDLYSKLLKLERDGRNGVWISVIRNSFAPLLMGKFDYVVGNPPWVSWDSLSEKHRKLYESLWERYEIVGAARGSEKRRGARGAAMAKRYGIEEAGAGFKRDLSMLFLARCFDLYLKPGGKLAFLMPLTVFKTRAGAGFRRFLATKTKILEIHDFVTLYPFEGAVNRASAVVLEKVCELGEAATSDKCLKMGAATGGNKRIKHTIWISGTGGPIPTNAQLEMVLDKMVRRYEAVMTPIVEGDPSSPWMQIVEKIIPYIRKVTSGKPTYLAHEGVITALNQVYYIQIKERLPDGKLLITNPPEAGQKKKVKQVEDVVEPDLIYPLVRGRDVKRWYVDYRNRYIIVPHDPETGKPLPEGDVKRRYPGTYEYLSKFKKELLERRIRPLQSLRKKVEKARRGVKRDDVLKKLEESFYILSNVSSYTFAPYKVVWKYVAGAVTGKAASFECAVLEPIGGGPAIPHEKLILIPFDSPDEAYYVAGVLNSSISRLVVASYTIETEISAHVAKHVVVPKFDKDNPLHSEILRLSREAHEVAKCIYAPVKPDYCENIGDPDGELRKIEEMLDRAVAKLYEIPEGVLEDIKHLLNILSGSAV